MAETPLQNISTVYSMERSKRQQFKSTRTQNFSNLIKIPITKTQPQRTGHSRVKVKSPPPPNVMVVNARSVCNNLNELEILVDNNNSDIVFFTETWLTDNIPDEAINCLGMNLVRLDRKHGIRGEVALLINSKIPFKARDDLSCPLFECLWVTVRPKRLP